MPARKIKEGREARLREAFACKREEMQESVGDSSSNQEGQRKAMFAKAGKRKAAKEARRAAHHEAKRKTLRGGL